MHQLMVSLSHLVPGKRNPRRVKPDQEAHRRLVALIKAHGLLHPLVVRPVENKPKYFQVVAGGRRLAALREIHRGSDPKIPCVLKKVDEKTADALSLGENFGREPMHPMDEAEAFAHLAREDGKDAAAIAADFGVDDRYVRQRMKLATLAEPIKVAHRAGTIDTGTAEAFAAVPEGRQREVWQEVRGEPRSAEHVRNIIANGWIDAERALFDRSTIPQSAVSQDLFGDKVLIERRAFLDAQEKALVAEQKALTDDGWSEVVLGKREDVQDRLLSMNALDTEYDPATTRKLAKIDADCRKLEKAARKMDGDEPRLSRLQSRFEGLEQKRRQLEASAPVCFSEKTKARATVFLILNADGQVERQYRVTRRKSEKSGRGGHPGADGNTSATPEPEAPTSDDLGERQLSMTFTHQALCVREALHKNALARKRVLALLLHDKVRSEALAMRHDANGTTLQAGGEGFTSPANDHLTAIRGKLDPFVKHHVVEDVEAYTLLGELPEKKLDALIDVLLVQLITAHPQRATALVTHLAEELKVNVREEWRPDAAWLGGFQKIQLAHLVTELKGSVHAPGPERKKSELVDQVAKLFTDAAEGKLEDKALVQTLNRWLPANLRKGNR